MAERVDAVVIGAGVVGLWVARTLLGRRPGDRVVVLDKEDRVAAHQTGHNSGVLHSGIYYTPGSLKARTSRAGRLATERFCEAEGLPLVRSGKVIVATRDAQLPALDALHQRGLANGVSVRRLGPEELTEREPAARGVGALWVADAGVVDFTAICGRLAERLGEAGAEVRLRTPVTGLARRGDRVEVTTPSGTLLARRVVNCAGLQSDEVAALAGEPPPVRIVPFRGEYRLLTEAGAGRVRGLVYPVPDPRFPFLGVHLTRTVDGRVKAGPNAVLAPGKEAYRRGEGTGRELARLLAWPGTRRLIARHWRMGLAELWRARVPGAFAASLRSLMPSLAADWLQPGPTGVRAQAVSRAGRLIDDFVLVGESPLVHVVNAPSPAATAAPAIAEAVVDRLLGQAPARRG